MKWRKHKVSFQAKIEYCKNRSKDLKVINLTYQSEKLIKQL